MTLYQKLKGYLEESEDELQTKMLKLVVDEAGEEVGDGMMMNIIKKHADEREVELFTLDDLPELDNTQQDRYEVLTLESLFLQNLMPVEWDEEQIRTFLSDKDDVAQAKSMSDAISASINHLENLPVNASIVAKVTRELWEAAR
jgi:hypothetical protein